MLRREPRVLRQGAHAVRRNSYVLGRPRMLRSLVPRVEVGRPGVLWLGFPGIEAGAARVEARVTRVQAGAAR